MATQQETVDLIVRQAGSAGDVWSRKMFGEHTLYCDGKVVGLICDDQLFVKPTQAGRAFLGDLSLEEAPPYRGAKPCLLVPSDRWADGDWLAGLIRRTADALPPPKPRKRT